MLRITRKLSPFRSPNHHQVFSLYLASGSGSGLPLPLSLPSKDPKPLPMVQNPNCFFPSAPLFFSSHSFSPPSPPPPPPPPLALALLRGGCSEEFNHPTHSLPLCLGCGIHMQDSDPKFPGFFSAPTAQSVDYHARIDRCEVNVSSSLKMGFLQQEEEAMALESIEPVVCARCHSLRHYGKVKNAEAENLLPDFDFDRMVGPKIVSLSGARSVVLLVVDAGDFDGSFPRKVARMVSDCIDENSTKWKKGETGNVPRMVLVVTKIDLLPPSVSPTGLEYWARQRAREGGAIKLAAVHLVSATRDWGVRNLVEHMGYLAGPRGSVWAVGAQNAGKSTLINAMAMCVKGDVNHLTEASVPGTTLGIVRVNGVLSEKAKLFDTPGILHPYQLSTRLTREEQKLVHIGKTLRPRTYRVKAGHSIHIAGLMRLDVEETSLNTIYITVWASPLLPLHMGKMENACTFVEDHFGRRLQPPIGEKRLEELGSWVRTEYIVAGKTWNVSSVDIAAGGLGWFAIGLNGEARVGVWTYDGIDVVMRSSVIPERAEIFEVAGFTVSKILSGADRALSKQKNNRKKRMPEDSDGETTSCPNKRENAQKKQTYDSFLN